MKASIVILNWKGKYEDCLESVQSALKQSYSDKEIIFVDNGSEDETLELLKQDYPDLKYIELPTNLGVTGGRNRGGEASTGELIFFLENDGAWASQNIVKDTVDLFEKYENLGVIYTAVEGYDTGIKDQPVDPHKRADKGPLISSSFRGGAAIIRRKLFNEIGGFPNEYFRQNEEKYFSIFTYDLGYIIAYVPYLVMRHKGSDYKGKSNVVSWYGCINDLKTIIRHYPCRSKYYVVFFKYIIWQIRFILQGQVGCLIRINKVLFKEIKDNSRYKKVSPTIIWFIEKMNVGYFDDILLENFDINLMKQQPKHGFLAIKMMAKLRSMISE
jgi:GT2 family glycosyltransferase